MQDLRVTLNGDSTFTSRQEPAPMPLHSRVATIAGGSWSTQAGVTGNFADSFAIAAEQFPPLLAELASIAADLAVLEDQLEAKGAPWTPSRIPEWTPPGE